MSRTRELGLIKGPPPDPHAPDQPAQGPPWIHLLVLYDWQCEGLHDLMVLCARPFGKATKNRVHITYFDSPADSEPEYESYRAKELKEADELGAKQYVQARQRGRSERLDRLLQVEALAKELDVPPSEFPCFAITAFPLCLPVGLLKLRPEWVRTEESRRRIGVALEGFLRNGIDWHLLLKDKPTNRELVRRFQSLADNAFGDTGTATAHPSPTFGEKPLAQGLCESITHRGREYLDRAGYELRIKTREEYDLLVDGITRKVWRRYPGRRALTIGTIPARKLAMLKEYVLAETPLRPGRTRVAAEIAPHGLVKFFEAARRCVDMKDAKGAFTYFHTIPASNPSAKEFLFRPPADAKYCFLFPASPEDRADNQ